MEEETGAVRYRIVRYGTLRYDLARYGAVMPWAMSARIRPVKRIKERFFGSGCPSHHAFEFLDPALEFQERCRTREYTKTVWVCARAT